MNEWIRKHPATRAGAIGVALTLLGLIVGFSQVKTEGLGWQEANYLPRLEAVVSGDAPAPWQYRVLTDHLVVAACRLAEAAGLPRPVGLSFVILRVGQNLALFGLAFLFYRRLGIPAYGAVLGLSALAWAMTQMNYGSDLAFNASTDVLCYLAAALALLHKRYHWLVPLTAIAALNRETSGLIPAMALVWYALLDRADTKRTLLHVGCITAVTYGAIQLVLNMHYGIRPWALHPSGAEPGLALAIHNLRDDAAWGHVAGALGIVPLLALAGWRAWHPALRPVFWAVAPLWLVIHVFCAPLDESRVMLLPMVLVFVPGMLCAVVDREEPTGYEGEEAV